MESDKTNHTLQSFPYTYDLRKQKNKTEAQSPIHPEPHGLFNLPLTPEMCICNL